MNLLTTPWLPVRLHNGTQEIIPVTAISRSDIADLALPRTDFQGAAYQLIVGALQCACPPDDEDDWRASYRQPPAPHEVSDAFSTIAHAFNVTGDGPLFMQDFDLLDGVKSTSIAALLIEAPGDNGIKNNTDFFIKRGFVEQLSLPMAALALFTLQINAPSGGQGHRTGLRGGGPLASLVLPGEPVSTLWQKLWLNVMNAEYLIDNLPGYRQQPDFTDGSVFPWLVPTHTSDKKGSAIFPNEVHPLHRYWAMPRRIRLEVLEEAGSCDLTGAPTEPLVRGYRTRNYGANYDGDWQSHPFTPYKGNPKKPQDDRLSIKGQPGGITYKIWDVLRLSADNKDDSFNPALVVQHHQSLMAYFDGETVADDQDDWQKTLKLWAFAYDMDNMKPRGFYSTEMPLVALPTTQQQAFFNEIRRVQSLAVELLKYTRSALKEAISKGPKDAKGDTSMLDLAFWQRSESHFFTLTYDLAKHARTRPEALRLPAMTANDWLHRVQRLTIELFDETALSAQPGPRELKQCIEARNSLKRLVYGSKSIKRFIADYPKPESHRSEPNTPEPNTEMPI